MKEQDQLTTLFNHATVEKSWTKEELLELLDEVDEAVPGTNTSRMREFVGHNYLHNYELLCVAVLYFAMAAALGAAIGASVGN